MGLPHHMYSEQVHICTLSCVHACTPSYTSWYMNVPCRIRGGTHMYSLVYVRVHVCTPSYTSGYMYVPTRIRQGTQIYSVICSWVLNLLYYWAIVLVLCFDCFRLSAIFSVVVSVLRRCTITVLLHDTESRKKSITPHE